MGQKFFKLDGVNYDIAVVSLKRSASVLDGENAGRLKNGAMERDIIGTYYNYTMELDTNKLSKVDYDTFYYSITAPVPSHTVVFPFGQSELTFEAYVANVNDELVKTDKDGNEWEGLSAQFTAMKPQRRPA